jgi:hypothetical protein
MCGQEVERHLCVGSGGLLKWTTALPSASAGYFVICGESSYINFNFNLRKIFTISTSAMYSV